MFRFSKLCRKFNQISRQLNNQANTTEAFNPINSNSNPNNNTTGAPGTADQADITARKIGEVLINPLGNLTKGAYEYTKGFIKETVRPNYWIPDEKAPNCMICDNPFGSAEECIIAKTKSTASSTTTANTTTQQQTQENISNGNMSGSSTSNILNGSYNISSSVRDSYRHHCRRCGLAICGYCSKNREPVLEHGWEYPVRICDKCSELNQSKSTINEQIASGNKSGNHSTVTE